MGIPEKYSPLNLIQKEMLVNSTPKLTQHGWVEEQHEDVDNGATIQLLKASKLVKYVAKETDSSGMQVLLKYRKDLFLKNRLLYQKVILKNHSEQISQFVLPKNFICKVILACHDDNGHLGMERTLGLLQEWFFWPKMGGDVWTHIRTFDQCLKCKQPQQKSEMQPVLVSYPLELVHLDFLTLGGKTDDSKSVNVLVVTDHFTKYPQAYVTPKQTAVIVAKTLWANFIVHYGWPEKILTDQGKSFENNLMQELCKLAQVKKLHTTPYHPQTNGQCKHFNATLIGMLGTLPTHAKRKWQEWIATLTHAYNCTVSSITGFSPYFLMFGKTPRTPLDVEMGVTLVDQGQGSYQNYAKMLQAKLKWAYQKAHENNKKEFERQKRYNNQKMKFMSLKPVDLVLVHVKAPSGQHKIIDRWEDKQYRVLNQLDDQPVFQVQPADAVDNENIRILHRNMLFPVQTVRDQSPTTTTTESVNDNKRHFSLIKANLLMDRHFDN